MPTNPSGLSDEHRVKARDLTIRAAHLGLKRQASLQYTQGSERWQGIDKNLKAWQGECPTRADCSAFATWCLWNGLDHFGVRDTVNRQQWKAGYTGTMFEHGVKVSRPFRADLVLYGDPFGRSGHVALYVGGGMVISFGGEPGPRLLPINYRPVTALRRAV